MKRRSFLKHMLPMGMAPFMLGGLPLRTMARSLMTSSFSCADLNDRVLVLIQLHGGNDGLNTFIPLDQYGQYRNLRPNIGVKDTGLRQYVPLDNTLPSEQQIGLHPDLIDLKHLYDEGKVRIMQNVAYDHVNGSHFRGTDIWLSGMDPSTLGPQPDSGWWGRYLDHRFPGYPDAYPNPDLPDPPGLEFGSHIISLGFHRQSGIPMGLTLANDPTDFANSVLGSGTTLPDQFPNSDYGRELEYLVQMERSTNLYADRLTNLYNAGANTVGVHYPETYHTYTVRNYRNPLAPQLKTIARLLSGGITTKIFLARIGGFDTHEGQGLPDKPSFGSHGALLYHLSSAMRAFQEDLKGLGLEDRVLTVTFSEFGRTVAENSTFGTDHGNAAPMMAFGKGINPGVSGDNPDLSNLQNNRLVGYDLDYRQVFATVLQDWFGANYGTLDHAEFYEFGSQKIELVNANYTDPNTGQSVNFVADTSCDPTPNLPEPPPPPPDPVDPTGLDDAFEATFRYGPNPASDWVKANLSFDRMAPAQLTLVNQRGQLVRQQDWRLYAGDNQAQLSVQGLSAGVYFLRVMLYPGGFSQRCLAQEKLRVE